MTVSVSSLLCGVGTPGLVSSPVWASGAAGLLLCSACSEGFAACLLTCGLSDTCGLLVACMPWPDRGLTLKGMLAACVAGTRGDAPVVGAALTTPFVLLVGLGKPGALLFGAGKVACAGGRPKAAVAGS